MATVAVPSSSIAGERSSGWTWTHAPSAFEWLFVVTGGLALALPLVWWLGEQGLTRTDLVRWYFWTNALISSPHVYATYVRLARKIRERRVSWLWGLPGYGAAIALLTAASWAGYFIEAMTLVNVWQSFHYVRQSYGVACMYGRQDHYDAQDRRLRWWGFHLIFPMLVLGRWDTVYTAWQGRTYSFMPMQMGTTIMSVLWAVAAVGVLVALLGEARLISRNGRRYSPTGLVCFLTAIGIHVYGFVVLSHFQRGFFAVTIYHSMQYLALLWVTEHRQAAARGWRWAQLVPGAVGFALFWGCLFALGYGYEQKVTVALSSYWTQASAILLAAVSVHHYTVDTLIWRRSVGA